jgi:hypothetical protein
MGGMANIEMLTPTVIEALNAQREGFGDALNERLKDGVAQAVDDYLTEVIEAANRDKRMEGPDLREITKAAVLALVVATAAPAPAQMQLDAEARERAGAGAALGRGLRR